MHRSAIVFVVLGEAQADHTQDQHRRGFSPRVIRFHETGKEASEELGLKTLRWLVKIQTTDSGSFRPIGSNGFYPRGYERAIFDQQPIEAQATISACIEAYHATGDMFWVTEARRAFEWFLGRNDLGLALYDPGTGGCRDGLHMDQPRLPKFKDYTLENTTRLGCGYDFGSRVSLMMNFWLLR